MTQTAIHPPTVRNYIHEQALHGELIGWSVLVHAAGTTDRGAWAGRTSALPASGQSGSSAVAGCKSDPTSLGVITDPGDELYGLSDEDIEDAEERAPLGEYPPAARRIERSAARRRVS